MRKTSTLLAVLVAVGGIGGTGRAAPLPPAASGGNDVAPHATMIDKTATPPGRCGHVAADLACRKQATSFVAAAALAQDWSGARLAAFARLVTKADAFARAVAANETDRMDDRRAAEAAEKAAFLQALRAVAGRTRDGASAAALDAALNAAYARVMAVRDTQALAWGSVDKAGIRRTERAWLAYRDAFTAFAATLEAPDAAAAVEAELTRRRTASLEGFLED